MAARKKRKKIRLSAEERKKRKLISDHKKLVRSTFRYTGFERFPKLADKEFNIDGTASDFDDIYVFENIVACIEYTTTKSVGDHLKKKKIVYDKVESNPRHFIETLSQLDDSFSSKVSKYDKSELIIKFVYCSRFSFEKKYEREVPNPIFLNYPELRYFSTLCDCIRISAFPELIEFLEIDQTKIGVDGAFGVRAVEEKCKGSLLPEANSNFDDGFKVVTFYIDPKALLKRAYVLRKQGWKQTSNPYQRMISKSKITSIRKHLKTNKRVFVNNIIATLADDTEIINEEGKYVDPKDITQTQPITIQIPDRINTVGLIDGQHRTFSYHVGIPDDPEIDILRRKQNLLVTGIIYPSSLSEAEREKFEARLFLEINSTQTNAKSNLKQEINLILEPFSDESIATRVLTELDRSSGPLADQIEQYWFDEHKLKPTSIISYGMKSLVKTSGEDSLYSIWSHPEKDQMVSNNNYDLLAEYVEFCVSQINLLLIETKKRLDSTIWTPDKRVPGRILTTTTVNCLLICLRLLIENRKPISAAFFGKAMTSLTADDFGGFHSSRYKMMAEALYSKHFSKET